MGFLDKAKAAAEQAANKANETVAEVQTKRELTKAYGDLGETAYGLATSGAISHPALEADIARIRELQAKLAEEDGGTAAASDAGDASGTSGAAGAGAGTSDAAGAGAGAAAADASTPAGS